LKEGGPWWSRVCLPGSLKGEVLEEGGGKKTSDDKREMVSHQCGPGAPLYCVCFLKSHWKLYDPFIIFVIEYKIHPFSPRHTCIITYSDQKSVFLRLHDVVFVGFMLFLRVFLFCAWLCAICSYTCLF